MINIDNTEDVRHVLRNMRTNYYEIENYREPWNEVDNDILRNLFYGGYGISYIAVYLGRSERATFKQVENLELFRRIYKPSATPKKRCRCSACPLNGTDACPKDCDYAG